MLLFVVSREGKPWDQNCIVQAIPWDRIAYRLRLQCNLPVLEQVLAPVLAQVLAQVLVQVWDASWEAEWVVD